MILLCIFSFKIITIANCEKILDFKFFLAGCDVDEKIIKGKKFLLP